MQNIIDQIKFRIQESISVKETILQDASILRQIEDLAQVCLSAIQSNNKIIFAGNGGSFADSQHLSAEFVSRFLFDRDPLPSIALGTNSSSVTAIGNDYNFSNIFSRELECLGATGDVFIPISTSGNSQNIIEAINTANKLNIYTCAFSGKGGGKIGALCQNICIPSDDTARIQESHILVGHILCEIVEYQAFKK